jgi:anti-sigma factor RsiW
MSCRDFQPFIGAYIDDEFDERETAEFEAHIEGCPECRSEFEEQLKFKQTLCRALDEEENHAPDELKERILCGIDEIDAEEEGSTGRTPRAAAALAAIVPLSIGVVFALWFMPSMTVAPAESQQPPVVDQTVDWHRHDFPVEIDGPDRTQVSEWFRGKVDFPVRLPSFAKEGVALRGGRIAHIQDRRAAYLSYEVNGARMSVMMFHGDGMKVPASHIRSVGERDVAIFNNDGYEVALLQDGGITYTITSDLAEKELVEIVGSSLQKK